MMSKKQTENKVIINFVVGKTLNKIIIIHNIVLIWLLGTLTVE